MPLLVDPDLNALRSAVAEFGGGPVPETSWIVLTSTTGGRLDLAVAAHRTALHTWLNAWGCRIRYSRDGEPDMFDTGILAWWNRWRSRLPGARVALADLTERHLAGLGAGYLALATTEVSGPIRPRTLGSTAAAKALYALRPRALMPWDQAIAERLHGARDGDAYVAHLRLGQRWSRRLLAESGLDEARLCAELGRPGRSLAKVLDEYCYLTCTRDGR